MSGNLAAQNQGQPNGRGPRPALTQAAAAGVGGATPYGQAGQLQQAVAQTPQMPGEPVEHPAITAMRNYQHNVTPLFAPTQNPLEPVTAGAPLDPGPTHPMAQPMAQQQHASILNILQQAAAATGDTTLTRLANEAQSTVASPPPAPIAEPPLPMG